MIVQVLASLLISLAPADDPYKAVAEAYIDAFDKCDDASFAGLFGEDHRGFLIKGGMNDGFTAPNLKRQCRAGYVLSVSSSKIAAVEHSAGFGSALIEIRAQMERPDGTVSRNSLRVSLMMEDRGEGPRIVRSHISALR